MKKLLAVLAIALVAAAAVWIIVRVHLSNQRAAVPELLPESTLLLVQAQDLKRMRERWHESDLYQLWREPAVQTWLQKPLDRLPQEGTGRKSLDEFLHLAPTDAFVALTALEKSEPKILGGFHFEATAEEARKFIAQRESEWLPKTARVKRETIAYEQHEIEKVTVEQFALATTYDKHWFFASNDVATLKLLLDRVDRRREKSGRSLQENATFADATRHLPPDYSGMIYLDPRPFVEKLMPFIAMTDQSFPMNQLERLRQVRSVASAIGLEKGRMRETDFVAMPRVGTATKLRRTLFGAAGANTFLYSLSRVHWSDKMLSSASPALGLPVLVGQFASALAARGISSKDLRLAFGEELELVSDWPGEARWPAIFASLPVRDRGRAEKIAEALTAVEIAGTPWSREEKSGAIFFSAQPFGGFVPLHPAIAVTDKLLIAGSDLSGVEATLGRLVRPADELEKSENFRGAAARVSPAESAFNYVDTRLLYERADAALRPLLLMGATFYPALGKNVDVSKLPPPEAIAKHLSPIVMSQRYEGDGYVTESVGPVTFREATVGLAGIAGGLFMYLREGSAFLDKISATPTPAPAFETPTATPEPSESPSASPF